MMKRFNKAKKSYDKPVLIVTQIEATDSFISEQEYFDNCTLLAAFLKAGIELAYETMIDSGIKAESAYYESLHETIDCQYNSKKKTL